MGSLTREKDQTSSDHALNSVAGGISQIRAVLCYFPKGCSCKYTCYCPCGPARSLQQLLVSLEPSCEQLCWETPRLVKAKVCQQSKQPASSSKGSHSLGITRVLCPGTEHLFLETGATGVIHSQTRSHCLDSFPAPLPPLSKPRLLCSLQKAFQNQTPFWPCLKEPLTQELPLTTGTQIRQQK